MYTINITGTDVDKITQRRTVYVSFIDGQIVIQKAFSFRLSDTFEDIKKAIRSAKEELEQGDLQNIPTGVVDITAPVDTPVPPTQSELDKAAWQSEREKLRQLIELVRDGVFSGTETQIVNLKAKVKADFKPAYLD